MSLQIEMMKTKRSGLVRSQNPFETVPTYICGPFSTPILSRQQYFFL